MRMHETGLIDTWLKAGYPRMQNKKSILKAKTITLGDVQSAFYLVGIGVTSGLITWILEHTCHRVRKCKVQRNQSVTLHRMQSFEDLAMQ